MPTLGSSSSSAGVFPLRIANESFSIFSLSRDQVSLLAHGRLVLMDRSVGSTNGIGRTKLDRTKLGSLDHMESFALYPVVDLNQMLVESR